MLNPKHTVSGMGAGEPPVSLSAAGPGDDATAQPAGSDAASASSAVVADASQVAVEAPLSPEELRRRAFAAKAVAAAFGETVAILLKTPGFKQMPIGELETMVVPAIAVGQFKLAGAQSQIQGITSPVAVILWARVSDAVDGELAVALDQPIRLKPQDWRSGDHHWVIEAIGEQRVLATILQRLRTNELADKPVKVRVRGNDGKPEVRVLEPLPKAVAPTPPAA